MNTAQEYTNASFDPPKARRRSSIADVEKRARVRDCAGEGAAPGGGRAATKAAIQRCKHTSWRGDATSFSRSIINDAMRVSVITLLRESDPEENNKLQHEVFNNHERSVQY